MIDSCAELASACSAGRDCLGNATYCGAIQSEIATFFTVEATCKAGCADTTCLKDCKIQRVTGVNTVLAQVSIDGGGTGSALSACADMTQTCTDANTGCGATEFFCTAAKPMPDACYDQLVACKAACGHDHTCKYDCKQAYLQCEAGGGSGGGGGSGTPDAGVDAPPPVDAPMTTTGYTYTKNIATVTNNFCSGCHSGASAAGNYQTDTYQHLFGTGSDNTANIIAGDANSYFVTKIAGNHHNVLNVYPGFDTIARDWVVKDAAAQ